jgi:hypothetical protein
MSIKGRMSGKNTQKTNSNDMIAVIKINEIYHDDIRRACRQYNVNIIEKTLSTDKNDWQNQEIYKVKLDFTSYDQLFNIGFRVGSRGLVDFLKKNAV